VNIPNTREQSGICKGRCLEASTIIGSERKINEKNAGVNMPNEFGVHSWLENGHRARIEFTENSGWKIRV